jgi:hypothetical protein
VGCRGTALGAGDGPRAKTACACGTRGTGDVFPSDLCRIHQLPLNSFMENIISLISSGIAEADIASIIRLGVMVIPYLF